MGLKPRVRLAALVAAACALAGTPVPGQEPAKAPQSPQCTAARLVGTWERVSLLRNALSVQPPDAPLFVKFGADGYWSMMEMPDDRPKVDKPLEQQAATELLARFDKVEGGQGAWTVNADGSIVTRRHLVNIAPGGEGSNQDRLCTFEGEILALIGTGANRSPQARFKRLPSHPLMSQALVGTWERTSLTIDGKTTQPPAPPLVMILGEDGWFSQTALPTGRKPVGKPLEQWTVEDYVRSFGNVGASRGTYTVEGNVFTRKHVANVDPGQVGEAQVTQFRLDADTLRLRGATGNVEATFRRSKRLDTTRQ